MLPVIYAGITISAFVLAVLFRFEFEWPSDYAPVFYAALPLLVGIRLISSYLFRLSRGRWRFVGTHDLARLVAAVTVGSVVFFIVSWTLPVPGRVPRSVILIEWILTTNITAAFWISYRLGYERLRRRVLASGEAKRVLVLGAGEAGQMLVHEMRRSPTGFNPIGFLDDDSFKWGALIHGVEVIGAIWDLESIARALVPDELVVAVPSATPDQLREIVERCEATELPFKHLPGIREVLLGEAHLHQLREVRIEDLLGREPIELELPELAEDLRGKTVLITGAAGSIGSELARQVALHQPALLVVADWAETPLYYLDLDFKARSPGCGVIPVPMDVTDLEAVERVFLLHHPDYVFHAAAYKHVPMMQRHPYQAIRNNTLGTWRVAQAAGRHRAEKFVLVSTDKAVRPESIMGASKFLAERAILDLQHEFPETRFGAVRFGNVLGSNGSVIPLFEQQLANGQPLTVTDEQVTRYFMTIPEAVQLILQASLLPDLKGRVAMLEMGEPIKILDLARNLLRLAGKPYRLGETVIVTGLRPGEKTHEDLVAPRELTVETSIPKVHMVLAKEEGASPQEGRLPESVRDALLTEDVEFLLDFVRLRFPRLMGEEGLTPEGALVQEAE